MSNDRSHKPPEVDVGDFSQYQQAPTPQTSASALLHRGAGQPVYDPMFYVRMERAQAARDAARTARNIPYRKATGAPRDATPIPPSSGAALPAQTRVPMEQQLGADLGGVRVHTGSDSAQAASGLGARAFTVGTDVHFGAGEYQPGTKEGDRLLAHELTHTVQAQRSGIQRKANDAEQADEAVEQVVSQPGEPAEQEADAVADAATENLHGSGGKHVAGAGKQAAPAIGAKLSGPKIFRAGRDPLKSSTKNALGKGPTMGAMHVGNAQQAGVTRPPQHHVLPQEERAWFKAHGADVDNYCVNLDQAHHEALHKMGWNEKVMTELRKAEKAKAKGKLSLGEILAVVKPIMALFQIDKLPFVRYGSERP